MLALACEAGATSRLMRESGGAWELRHGPFDDAELDALPDGGWTVLVQQVDQIEPPVEALRSRFVDFLPRWRLDDVMVSYAPPGGGVGAHVDNYDVFLVQGRGARRWEVEGAPRAAAAEALVPGQPVRVLERFEAAASELLAPGDALYLPPRWAHRGTSEHKECMTYSVGFRAPSRAELVRHFADTVAARLPEDDRFADPPEADGALAAGGRVGPAAVDRARAMLRETLEEVLADDDAVAAWAAQALTAPPSPPPPAEAAVDGAAYAGEDDEGVEALVRSIADGDDDAPALRHSADAVLAYVNLPGGGVVSSSTARGSPSPMTHRRSCRCSATTPRCRRRCSRRHCARARGCARWWRRSCVRGASTSTWSSTSTEAVRKFNFVLYMCASSHTRARIGSISTRITAATPPVGP